MSEMASEYGLADWVIELNQAQLQDGIDSTDTRLWDIGGGYAPFTIEIKQQKGQRTDEVTLRDTGDFYDSMTVYVDRNGEFVIDADFIKDGTDLRSDWGNNILGLNDENLNKFVTDLNRFLIERLREILQGA